MMNISLTPEMEKIVQDRVSSGMYHTPSEVIQEALHLLHDRDANNQNMRDLRAEIQKGIESGPATPFDMEEFIQESKNRWSQPSNRSE